MGGSFVKLETESLMVTQEEKVHAKVREHDYLRGTPYWESALKYHNVNVYRLTTVSGCGGSGHLLASYSYHGGRVDVLCTSQWFLSNTTDNGSSGCLSVSPDHTHVAFYHHSEHRWL